MIFLALLIALPILEIAVFAGFVDGIGFLATILLYFLMAGLGIFIIQIQGIKTLFAIQGALDRAEMPAAALFDGMCLAAAGVLLLLPGFLSDALAFALMIPPLRGVLRRVLIDRFGLTVAGAGVIEGEYVRVEEDRTRIG